MGSRVVVGEDGKQAEASHIGREGMTGKAVVLGSSKAITRIVMQVAGDGLTIDVEHFAAAIRDSETLRSLMNSYVLAGDSETAHTLLSATHFGIEPRLARELLMFHDRIDGNDLPVTHGLLAAMLGVRRAGVTVGMHILEGIKAIRAVRGTVKVLSRGGLIDAASGSYGFPEVEYERLIPVAIDEPATPAPSSLAVG